MTATPRPVHPSILDAAPQPGLCNEPTLIAGAAVRCTRPPGHGPTATNDDGHRAGRQA